MPTETQIREALRAVIDPELGIDIITLGLIYNIGVNEAGQVNVRMTMTSRGCPLSAIITACVRSEIKSMPGVTDVTIDVVWEPAWTPDRIEPAGREALRL